MCEHCGKLLGPHRMDADRVQESVCDVCGKPGTLRLQRAHRGRRLAWPQWICSRCWVADQASADDRWRGIWETAPGLRHDQ